MKFDSSFLLSYCPCLILWHKGYSDFILLGEHSLSFLFLFLPCFSFTAAAAAAKSLQSSPTLCDLIDGSPLGSPVPGILQARALDWVAISFSNAWKWKVKVKSLSRVQFFATPWTATYQAPPSMGVSRQEYWSGVPSPSPFSSTFPTNSLFSLTFFFFLSFL